MKKLALVPLAGAGLALATSCKSRPLLVPEPKTVRYVEVDSWCQPPDDEVFVLAVDPISLGQDPALRAAVATALDDWVGKVSNQFDNGDEWHPVHWTLVVVSARSAGSARFIGPNDHPELALYGNTPTRADAKAWADAALAVATSDSASGLFLPIAASDDLVTLIAGKRAPADAREGALVSSIGSVPEGMEIAVVSLHDDEGTDPVAPLPEVGRPTPALDVVAPSLGACGTGPAAPRLDKWSQDGREPLWPCPIGDLFPIGFADGAGEPCVPPLARGTSGAPNCKVTALLSDLAAECDPARGWVDPLPSEPTTTVGPTGQTFRVCDVQQIAPASLVACQTEATAPPLPSGYCFANSSIFSIYPPCASNKERVLLRPTGGACAGSGAFLRVTCELQ